MRPGAAPMPKGCIAGQTLGILHRVGAAPGKQNLEHFPPSTIDLSLFAANEYLSATL